MTAGYLAKSPDATGVNWKDKKRYLWVLGIVVPLLPITSIALKAGTGVDAFLWLTPLMFFVVIPLIDLVTGYDDSNPPEEVIEALENDKYYRWVTYIYLPVQYAGFIAAIWYLAAHDLGVADRIAIAISVGVVGGVAINTAHELGHKREDAERWLSKIALAQTFYGHFYIEHNRGHHVRVATPEDPASARMGETIFEFWPRTVSGSLKSSWHLEKKRYARKDTHPFHLGNDVLNAWLMTVVLWGALTIWLGPVILPYLLLQAVVGFSLLEVVNYMEHYGMLRQKVGPAGKQRFERVNPSHSWNSNNIATNVLLYHLQRHSDHHANPIRRYQALRHVDDAPQLPTGYAGMIVLAIVPPIWRAVMDHRVLEHYRGELELANVRPGLRERTLSRYRCPGCGYVYDERDGHPREGFPPGTPWSEVPEDWACPDCGVRDKVDFEREP